MRATRIPAAAGLAAAVALAGCGRSAPAAAPQARLDGDAAVEAPATGVRTVDSFRAADLAFYAAFAYPEGAEAEVYQTLGAAAAGATVVVLGQVTDVRVTRLVGEPGDRVPYVGVSLRPVEVLRGSLPKAHAESLTVEFVSVSAAPDQLRASLPQGYGVWILRNKADLAPGVVPKRAAPTNERDYYRLASSQTLFVQGARHVVNPVAHDDGPEIPMPGDTGHGAPRRDPVVVAAEAHPTLSSLMSYVRSL